MKGLVLFSAALLFVTACGGGGGADNVVAPPVNVAPPAVASVSVALASSQVVAGTSTTATAETRAANGSVLTGRSVAWSSSAPLVATVDVSGVVTSISAGTATITATSESRSGSATLTVAPVPVASVAIVLAASQLVAGTSTTATAEIRGANGIVLSGRSLAWSSSAPLVATVDAAGTVTAVGTGTAVISATSEGQSGSSTLSVTPRPVATVLVSLAQSSVFAGTPTTAAATLRASDGSVLDSRAISWNSSNTSVATIDNAGRISTVAPGSTSISATSEGQTGAASLTVLPVPVASVSIAGETSLTLGSPLQLSATLRDVNGAELQGRSIVWGTSNTSVASVSASGLVTGIAPGTVSISASSEGRTGTLLLTVRSAVASVTLTGAGRVKVGDDYQYSVTARTSDGSVITRPVAWGTDDPDDGTFNASGRFTPATTGTITIAVLIDGETWTTTVTAYDWLSLSGNGLVFTTLPSDNQISNRFGSSEYPELTFVCSSDGQVRAWVATNLFVTANGSVAFSFDGGAPIGQSWLEFANFSSLGKTGTNATLKSFALQVAGSRLFAFAFGEFRGNTKVVSFRVSGLGPRLAPLFDACPGNNIESVVADALLAASASMQSSIVTVSPELEQLRSERALAGASAQVPTITQGAAVMGRVEMRAVRRK